MNKFTQHIPNFCDGFERRVFEFLDLDDLVLKLGGYASSLVYDDGHLLSVSKDGTEWRVIGRVDNPVEGLANWRGEPRTVIEIESVRGWGLDTFEPKLIGDSFNIYIKEDVKLYWGFRDTIMGGEANQEVTRIEFGYMPEYADGVGDCPKCGPAPMKETIVDQDGIPQQVLCLVCKETAAPV